LRAGALNGALALLRAIKPKRRSPNQEPDDECQENSHDSAEVTYRREMTSQIEADVSD
jgi:hypothetical protein